MLRERPATYCTDLRERSPRLNFCLKLLIRVEERHQSVPLGIAETLAAHFGQHKRFNLQNKQSDKAVLLPAELSLEEV